jgi:hypothetical protein
VHYKCVNVPFVAVGVLVGYIPSIFSFFFARRGRGLTSSTLGPARGKREKKGKGGGGEEKEKQRGEKKKGKRKKEEGGKGRKGGTIAERPS